MSESNEGDSASSRSSKPLGPQDLEEVNSFLRSQLSNQSNELKEAQTQNQKLQQSYNELLHKMQKQEKRMKKEEQNTDFLEELNQWSKLWERMVSTIAQVIPYNSVKPKSGGEQRAVLMDMLQQLCEYASNPKESKEYKELHAKHEKNKRQLLHMRGQCESLLVEIQNNRKILEKHMKEVRHCDRTSLEAKVSDLESILQSHVQNQKEFSSTVNIESRTKTNHHYQKTKTNNTNINSRKHKKARHEIIRSDSDEEEVSKSPRQIYPSNTKKHTKKTTVKDTINVSDKRSHDVLRKESQNIPILSESEENEEEEEINEELNDIVETHHSSSSSVQKEYSDHEAEEVLSQLEQNSSHNNSFHKKYKKNVNKLIDITNKVQKGRKRNSPTLSELSKINESLIIAEKQLDSDYDSN